MLKRLKPLLSSKVSAINHDIKPINTTQSVLQSAGGSWNFTSDRINDFWSEILEHFSTQHILTRVCSKYFSL